MIATAHGGNTDVCTSPLAHPVRRWHAAELMQQVAAQRLALVTDPEAAAAGTGGAVEVWGGFGDSRDHPPQAIETPWKLG